MAEISNTHTPDELLKSAEWLFALDNPNAYRASVLEAITALETYVKNLIVVTMNQKFGDDFAKWLEEKTRMDFDARVAVLVPAATGLKVDKSSSLWNRYQSARDIRNKVVHTGKKATKDEARSVIDTVYQWLEYLKGVEEVRGRIPDETLYQLAGRFLEASARLERVIYGATVGSGLETPRGRARDIVALSHAMKLPLGIVDEIETFRELRNRIAHGTRRDFVELNQKQVDRLNTIVSLLRDRLAAKQGKT